MAVLAYRYPAKADLKACPFKVTWANGRESTATPLEDGKYLQWAGATTSKWTCHNYAKKLEEKAAAEAKVEWALFH